jgi:hypothetical protein
MNHKDCVNMNIITRLIFIVGTLYVGGELVTRAFIALPAQSMPDPEIGWIYKPHARLFHTSEGWAVNQFNSMGFNDRELADSKEEKWEILVLGDSFTEAPQVPQSENFTSLVEAANPSIDVINAGRSGLSPIQYDILSKRFFEATLVSQVVVVLNSTDMEDIVLNNAEIIRDSSGVITEIKLNEKKFSWLRQALDIVLSNSALANYLKDRIRASLTAKRSTYRNSMHPSLKENEAKVRAILGFIFTKINNKAPLSVVYIPDLEFLPYGETRHKPKSAIFERIIEEVVDFHDIPYLSVEEYMKQSYKKYFRPPVGFKNNHILYGHLNKIGHENVKNAIMQVISTDHQSTLQVSSVLHYQ